MTTFRKSLFMFFGLCLLAAMPRAHADEGGPSGPASNIHGGQRIREIFRQLNLTEDQKKQLEANKQQHRARIQDLREEIKTSKDAIRAELMKIQLDMPKVKGMHDQIKALQDQMEDEKLNSILAVRAILTPEQFIKFVNLMHKHKEEHEE